MKPAAGFPTPRGMGNAAAARVGEIIVLTIPYASHATILGEIREDVANKVVIDATVPLMPPHVGTVHLPPRGSVAVATQEILGERATVVSTFHTVSAAKLVGDVDVDCDVLVFGDKRDARERVVKLVGALGIRGLHGGKLVNSVAAEAMTSVLIQINRRYGVKGGAGIRITGKFREQVLEAPPV